ncbi:MAG TPA: hypothetical protein GX396_02545 [Tissierellia bacterium]|nr:hypothetical protein [Tissierellia bacterium]
MEINSYNLGKTNNIDYSNLNIQKNKDNLNMQDFLNLLVAQITNQDVMNPMDNTEFIAQMAQFSSLQAMSDLTELAMQAQATSLIGKNVVVADYNNYGQLEVYEGIVQRVTLHSGKAKLYVDDKEYDYSNVMEIKEGDKKEDPVEEILKGMSESLRNIESMTYRMTEDETTDTESTGEDSFTE